MASDKEIENDWQKQLGLLRKISKIRLPQQKIGKIKLEDCQNMAKEDWLKTRLAKVDWKTEKAWQTKISNKK